MKEALFIVREPLAVSLLLGAKYFIGLLGLQTHAAFFLEKSYQVTTYALRLRPLPGIQSSWSWVRTLQTCNEVNFLCV